MAIHAPTGGTARQVERHHLGTDDAFSVAAGGPARQVARHHLGAYDDAFSAEALARLTHANPKETGEGRGRP